MAQDDLGLFLSRQPQGGIRPFPPEDVSRQGFTPPATGGEADLISMYQALTLGTWRLLLPHAPTDPGLFLLAPRRILGEAILLCRAGNAHFVSDARSF